MKLHKLLCVGFAGSELAPEQWDTLDALAGERLTVATLSEARAHPDSDALLVKLGAKVSQPDMEVFPELRYIGMLGTGYGGIDTTYAASKGIAVTNIADYATEGVAEFTLGIILEQLRDLARAKRQAASGDYSDDFGGREIRGKTWGIVGLGDIGRRTAQLAEAFGAEVRYWSRRRKEEAENAHIHYAELEEVLGTSDIITLNLALTSETEGFLSAERLGLIKPGVIIMNPSPMELVDFDALLKRLNRNDLTFLLDHSDEMTPEQLEALKPLPNCAVYPPIAYLTEEASQLKQQIYVDNLQNFLSGTPTNKVA